VVVGLQRQADELRRAEDSGEASAAVAPRPGDSDLEAAMVAISLDRPAEEASKLPAV
jgi:hypothetical protein